MKILFKKGVFETFFLLPTIVRAPISKDWGICWLRSVIWFKKGGEE